MDDLLNDLDSDRKGSKQPVKGIKHSEESEAFYRQNSKSNRQLRNKKSIRRETTESDLQFDDAWEGIGKALTVLQNKYCKVALKTQDGIRKNFEHRRAICRPLEIFIDYNAKTEKKEMRCWLLKNPSDGRLVAIAKFKTTSDG